MKKAVIFDMDGVICHTNPFHSLAFKEFFAKRDMYPTEEEFELHMYGKSNSYIMSHFFRRKIGGQELLELENEKEGLFREIYKDKVDPIIGFQDFFSQLKTNQFLTGVATSAPFANLKLIAGTLSLMDKMESILASEDVSKHKPDPEVYLKSAFGPILQGSGRRCGTVLSYLWGNPGQWISWRAIKNPQCGRHPQFGLVDHLRRRRPSIGHRAWQPQHYLWGVPTRLFMAHRPDNR